MFLLILGFIDHLVYLTYFFRFLKLVPLLHIFDILQSQVQNFELGAFSVEIIDLTRRLIAANDVPQCCVFNLGDFSNSLKSLLMNLIIIDTVDALLK